MFIRPWWTWKSEVDILKTQSSLPSGNIRLPDIPPSLEGKLPAATATVPSAAAADAAAQDTALTSHNSNGTSSSSNCTRSCSAASSGGSSQDLDQQDLVKAAWLLEEQQHPQHRQQQHHQPHRSVAISGLGLEVQFEDVRFAYQPEQQVRV
jgi:hypothetical protein